MDRGEVRKKKCYKNPYKKGGHLRSSDGRGKKNKDEKHSQS